MSNDTIESKDWRKLKNGDEISTIWGETAVIASIGNTDGELTKLDRDIQIGFYKDNEPCFNSYIVTEELNDIIEKSR